ncbi:MAG: undecaprenyl-phosphate glucose phosphotransferase [bacterium]|nr:undecaprenyl-phosphate glucose phosphotransferase [bacterium]
MKKDSHLPIFRIIFSDLLFLNFVHLYFVIVIKGYKLSVGTFGERYRLFLIVINLLWIFITLIVTRYRMDANENFFFEFKKILLNISIFAATVMLIAFSFKGLKLSRVIIFGTISGFFVFLVVSHLVYLKLLKFSKRKKTRRKLALIVGNENNAFELKKEIDANNNLNFNTILFLDKNSPATASIKESCEEKPVIVGDLSDAGAVFEKHKVDELIVILSSIREEVIRELVESADYHGIRVRMIPAFYNLFERNFKVDLLGDIPIINVSEIPLDGYYNSLYKRIFDVIFSASILVFFSPLYVIIALAVKLTSRGSVLFVPERIGIGGNTFKLYKFRTMFHSENKEESRSTQPNDSRITHLGRFLRKYNFDELPQFINALKGDMSVVGPRPHRVFLDKVMQDSVDKYMLRHYIKPGITGWAQVNGWRGPTGTEEQKIERTKHDLWYITNWSFLLDIKIILLTLVGRKARKNAF